MRGGWVYKGVGKLVDMVGGALAAKGTSGHVIAWPPGIYASGNLARACAAAEKRVTVTERQGAGAEHGSC